MAYGRAVGVAIVVFAVVLVAIILCHLTAGFERHDYETPSGLYYLKPISCNITELVNKAIPINIMPNPN